MPRFHIFFFVVISTLLHSSSVVAEEVAETTEKSEETAKIAETDDSETMEEVVDPYTGEKFQVKKGDLPQEKLVPGVAASSGKFSGGSRSVEQSSTGVQGEKTISPISASVSRPKGRKCDVTFRNNSKENGYRARYVAEARNPKGSGLQKKTISVMLKPGASLVKQISCYKGGSVNVSLKSGAKL